VNDVAAKAFVLALAIMATALIGLSGIVAEGEPPPPGGRFRRFVQRMKALGEVYSGRSGRR
jgi:hypothetical protein